MGLFLFFLNFLKKGQKETPTTTKKQNTNSKKKNKQKKKKKKQKPIAEKIEALLDELGLGEHIRAKAKGRLLYHMKFKVALAGCPNSCSQPQIKTFGIR